MRYAIALLVVGMMAVPASAGPVFDDFEGTYNWYEYEPSGRTGSNQIIVPSDPPGTISETHVLEIISDGPDTSGYDYSAQLDVPLAGLGDTIYASVWLYDVTGGNPSFRTWGHWSDADSVYLGSATGGSNQAYTAGTGWELMTNSWDATAAPAGTVYFTLELRVYGTGTMYADDVSVTPEPATLALLGFGGLALIRRRR